MNAKERAEKILFNICSFDAVPKDVMYQTIAELEYFLAENIEKAFEERGHAFQAAIQKCLEEKKAYAAEKVKEFAEGRLTYTSHDFGRVHSEFIRGRAEGYKAGVEEAKKINNDWEKVNTWENVFDRAVELAYEEAAKIAESCCIKRNECKSYVHDIRWCQECETSRDAANYIASKIRSHAAKESAK